MTVYEPPGTTGKPATAAATVRTLVGRADLEVNPVVPHLASFNQVSATLEWQRYVTAGQPADHRASA